MIKFIKKLCGDFASILFGIERGFTIDPVNANLCKDTLLPFINQPANQLAVLRFTDQRPTVWYINSCIEGQNRGYFLQYRCAAFIMHAAQKLGSEQKTTLSPRVGGTILACNVAVVVVAEQFSRFPRTCHICFLRQSFRIYV